MTIEQWQDQVALVTGASSGIGREVARRLLGAGMRVALWGRRADRLEALALAHPARSTFAPVDLRDDAAIVEGFSRCEAELGPVSVLVNAAGVGRAEPLCDGAVDAWREMFDVNVLGLSVVTREAVRSLRRRSAAGHIVHLSALSGYRVSNATGPYAATKFAVRALAETLRQELRRLGLPVRVTCVSPGFVETEFHASYFGDAERAEQLYRRQRVLDVGDVANAVLFALAAPPHVDVSDVLLRSTEQAT
jgi:NADP-dependent 3-hydroxy acid dehydrogenase YdfG